ncbi:unnamed protein product [Owenia fusiformis]|uniref:Uncharacterized protein n=1 Tax=Owenia fusiformis TaxID=6347 RepID=A0A8J1TUU3_OWEFU|nr:unnamed protein product [Owenia fusiformis]
MPRKSGRLQGKQKRESVDRPFILATRKRKAEEEPETEMAVDNRRQHFEIQNHWMPPISNSSVVASSLVPSENIARNLPKTPENFIGSTFRFQNHFTTPVSLRHSPLPMLDWANHEEVWEVMLKKDELYVRDNQVLNRHPQLQGRMRAILLDWLIEVCEVYRLHRESFYLCIDFIDRYLGTQHNVQKHQLQLIGITCLFIAAKLEEIYPPKISEFAYVTDGACTESEILDQELVTLKALKWDLTPMTVNSWLNVYLQLANHENVTQSSKEFVVPQYSSHVFVQIARLLDLCMLDLGCLQFSYSQIAASALYHVSTEHVALAVSGFSALDLQACVQWMAPFAITIRENGAVELKFFQNILPEDTHHIQTHSIDLNLLDKAQSLQKFGDKTRQSSSPVFAQQFTGILTPPHSSKKQNTNGTVV